MTQISKKIKIRRKYKNWIKIAQKACHIIPQNIEQK